MGFVEGFKTCIKKSFVLQGRASRSEYWSLNIVTFVLGFCGGFLGVVAPALAMLFFLASMACLPAAITVVVRRLHDIGLSGWWALLLGGFLLTAMPGAVAYGLAMGSFAFWVYVGIKKGTPGPNAYGPDPLGYHGPVIRVAWEQGNEVHTKAQNASPSAPSDADRAPAFCSQCGAPVHGGAYCSQCGHKLR